MLQPTPNKGPAAVAVPQQDTAQVKPARDYTKLLIPLSVVAAVLVLVGVSSQRWDRWMAGADTQTTDNAYIRAELSRLSARVSGNVSAINVGDFDHVKAGDVLVEIDPADYLAKQAQAKAALDAAVGQLANLENQKTLQKAAISQAEAQSAVAKANADLAKTEADRQVTLADKGVGTQQKNEQAQAAVQTTIASALAAEASVASARAQLEYISGQADQLSANVEAARAALKTADLSVSYTRIIAPFDGVVSERQVHVGDYVTAGTNSISIVPLPDVYMIANFKETQLSRMKEGQVATVTVDALPGESFKGHVTRLSPASGSQFALLPADNATGNFTKVVQRVPVRIDFEASPALEHLRSGMSAEVTISVASEGR
ncbi:HlyD family secretion protein [Agrobacterium tumefaciens]|jgi:membrane fusion protein (multidrug efflux system)|uniref:HlyD family secretion protein n=1 Tax=Agrobacterium tumefaciens TaxID=358 RepID=UPI0015743BCE|nr:HlyD family secretion protein [Agrobacterium tumefaciens]UXS39494.1 HlyD family secretion protein [Agrobacterium tumefaciens]UXT22447.1 HlyD family secretion protein [Agrobacterium tumefaciens]WHO22677.1 HlyD family secretion protein [Agrobacterium tumefaciens]